MLQFDQTKNVSESLLGDISVVNFTLWVFFGIVKDSSYYMVCFSAKCKVTYARFV